MGLQAVGEDELGVMGKCFIGLADRVAAEAQHVEEGRLQPVRAEAASPAARGTPRGSLIATLNEPPAAQ